VKTTWCSITSKERRYILHILCIGSVKYVQVFGYFYVVKLLLVNSDFEMKFEETEGNIKLFLFPCVSFSPPLLSSTFLPPRSTFFLPLLPHPIPSWPLPPPPLSLSSTGESALWPQCIMSSPQ